LAVEKAQPGEVVESAAEALVVDGELGTELGPCDGPVGADVGNDAIGEVGRANNLRGFGNDEMGRPAAVVGFEAEVERLRRRMLSVLDSQLEQLAVAGEIGIGVAPGPEVARSAEALSGASAAVFAGVVDEKDGDAEAALEGAEVGEESGHVGGVVFVQAMEPDERIEHEEARFVLLDGSGETVELGREIEPHVAEIEEVEVDAAEVEPTALGEPGDARTRAGEGILGEVDEDGSGPRHGEAAEGRRAGGDGEREIEGHPRLTTLRMPSKDADTGLGPEGGDEPGGGSRLGGEIGDVDGGERLAGHAIFFRAARTMPLSTVSIRRRAAKSRLRRAR
jgi:hypothetical protein